MGKQKQLDIEIDKLTRSIENAISGDSFKTEVLKITTGDLKTLKTKEWLFNWKSEFSDKSKSVYKLVIAGNDKIIQGLISLEDKGDHCFMHLIESNKFNKGSNKIYLGVPGNLVAFACMESFSKGYGGVVSFESKTKLIAHYQLSLGAKVLFGNYMAINSAAAAKLVRQYFPDFFLTL